MDEQWIALLQSGHPEEAWDALLGRYRRLIFAGIRHYARDYDDTMEVFAHVCAALREDGFRRLRTYAAEPVHRARFSTWLVTVVRNLTVDWFRRRDGRRRLPAMAEGFSPLQRGIFEQVFLQGRSHAEAYGILCTGTTPPLSYKTYQAELRAVYRAATGMRRGVVLRELAQAPWLEEADGPPTMEESAERAERLEQALGSLSPEDRTAVELYVMEELPAADVARITGLPNAKAVYNRVYRALGLLREELQSPGFRREDL